MASGSTLLYLLTDEDMTIIKESVEKRMTISAESGLNHATTYKRSTSTRIKEESVGVAAELSWARLNGRDWHDPINEFHEIPDDGVHEIRATDHPGGGLIIRNNDSIRRKYIFALVNGRRCEFHGWAYGHEVKKNKYKWNPYGFRPAWRMGREDLHPMDTL